MSNNYNTLTIAFLCMIWVTSWVSVSNAISYWRFSYTVHIMNGMPDNAKPLKIKCWSMHDDLGHHTLWKGQEFKFDFSLHWVLQTNFDCDFQWGSKSLKKIRVFSNGIGYEQCYGHCYWKATPHGLHLSDNSRDWALWYKW
ncbi:hypothetical protein GQ457_12G019470 [Hibiscus cannabinus]